MNINLNLKTRFVWKKKKNTMISEMLFIKVLWAPSPVFVSLYLSRTN